MWQRKLSFHSGGWPEGRAGNRRNGAQKLLGVLITIGEAVAYVVSGMYGDVRELGAGNAILIIVQVCLEGANFMAAGCVATALVGAAARNALVRTAPACAGSWGGGEQRCADNFLMRAEPSKTEVPL